MAARLRICSASAYSACFRRKRHYSTLIQAVAARADRTSDAVLERSPLHSTDVAVDLYLDNRSYDATILRLSRFGSRELTIEGSVG